MEQKSFLLQFVLGHIVVCLDYNVKSLFQCAGYIPQGEACGDRALGCCGHMVCLTYMMRSCPRWANKHDCYCMPRNALQRHGKKRSGKK